MKDKYHSDVKVHWTILKSYDFEFVGTFHTHTVIRLLYHFVCTILNVGKRKQEKKLS